jgi:hypothetical protein
MPETMTSPEDLSVHETISERLLKDAATAAKR